MARETVEAAAAVETWTSFVKAALGAMGFVLLAIGPLVPSGAFQFLPHYSYTIGAILVVTAATMRLRTMLIVVGCIALTAALACTLAGGGSPSANQAALALYCAAALVLGAAARHPLMAIAFLAVPVLVVAPDHAGWLASRDAFIADWESALGGRSLLAGLPAALAVAGAAIGRIQSIQLVPVRPSAFPLLIACAGLVMAGLVIGSLLPGSLATAQLVCLRAALIAGVLGWTALAYQVGRTDVVWQAAVASLLFLAGALFVDRATQFPDALGAALGITIATSLMPAALAGVGLLARRWIGTERPVVARPSEPLRTWSEAEHKAFLLTATTAPARQELQPGPAPEPPADEPSSPEPSDGTDPHPGDSADDERAAPP
jgi:hypothetical protein